MFEFNKGNKWVAIALMLIVLIVLIVSTSKLRQIKMDFSTKQLEVNFEQANMSDKSSEKNYE